MVIKLILGLAVLAGISGGAWYWSTQKHPPASEQESTADTESADANGSGTATFGELASRGGSSKCSISTTHAVAASTGIAYIADGKVRVDFTAKSMGMTVNGHVIQADGYAYTWTDLVARGVKVQIDAAPAAAASQGFDSATQVEYSCEGWASDPTVFEIPSTVTFTEFKTEAQSSGATPLPQ